MNQFSLLEVVEAQADTHTIAATITVMPLSTMRDIRVAAAPTNTQKKDFQVPHAEVKEAKVSMMASSTVSQHFQIQLSEVGELHQIATKAEAVVVILGAPVPRTLTALEVEEVAWFQVIRLTPD